LRLILHIIHPYI